MDTNLVLRTGAVALTTTEALAAVEIGPMNPNKPLWCHISVPAFAEAGDGVDVKMEFYTAADVLKGTFTLPRILVAQVGVVSFPFFTWFPKIKVTLTVYDADSQADANFGAVKVWIDTAKRYNLPQ